jgi:hypothetical protein
MTGCLFCSVFTGHVLNAHFTAIDRLRQQLVVIPSQADEIGLARNPEYPAPIAPVFFSRVSRPK